MFMVKSRKYTSSDIHVSRKNLAVPVFLQVKQVDLRSQMRSKNNRTYYGLNFLSYIRESTLNQASKLNRVFVNIEQNCNLHTSLVLS